MLTSGYKIYFLLASLIIGMLLINSVPAFPPPSPEQEKAADEIVRLCESTGGVANKTSVGGYDSKTGIDRAWSILVDCDCPEGFDWDNTEGCIKKESISIQK